MRPTAAASAPEKKAFSNYTKEVPVRDAVFEGYQRAFDYDRAPLHARKKYLVHVGGHDVPRTDLIKETLAWLDKYLGPVR